MHTISKIVLLALVSVSSLTASFATGIGFVVSERYTEQEPPCDKRLIGTWYQKSNGGSNICVERITVLKSDGSYIVRVRHSSKDEKVLVVTSTGVWGTHKGLYVTMPKTVQFEHGDVRAGPSDCVAIHQIVSADEGEFQYRLYGEDKITIDKKVADDFDFKSEPNKALVPTATTVTPAADAPVAPAAAAAHL